MNKYKIYILLFMQTFSMFLHGKKILKKNNFQASEQATKEYSWFKVVSLENILQKNPNVKYQKCFGQVNFEFELFSLSQLVPYKGYFKECFILEIPDGKIQGKEGLVFINNQMPEEMIWANRYEHLQNVPQIDSEKIKKMSGRVAVISQVAHDNYCHFFNEILARLAMLEMHNVEYDWLYVTCDKNFVKEGLKIWGIDESKIICPTDKDFCIQADTLILPSLVLNTNNGFKHTGVNTHPYTLQYVKEKLLSRIESQIDTAKFCKRIFISRRDAPSRKIINEDEVFELFKAKSFERYDTGKMSVLEQIALFAQAEMVVGEHGAGLTGIMFCKEGTMFIELFQALIDSSFWFPAQIFNLNYIPVNTLNVNGDVFYNWQQKNPNIYFKAMGSQVNISLEKIKNIVDSL